MSICENLSIISVVDGFFYAGKPPGKHAWPIFRSQDGT